MAAAGFSKFLFIPLVLLLGQIDFKDESVLFIARCAFYTAGAVTLLTNYIIKGMVTSANDTTRIWVPPPQTGFLPDPNAKLVESTYKDFESNLVAENIKKTLIMLGMMSFLSFKMGLHMPVGIQAAMLPLELFTSPLVFKYLFGSKSESPYGEKLEPPEDNDDASAATTAGAAGAGAAGAGATDAAADAAASPEGAKATTELLDFIMDRWNEEKTFTFKQLDKFLSKGADINAQTPVEPVENDPDQLVGGMTALMVACAFPTTKKGDLIAMLSHGASLVSADHDEWTPLHWAAHYGSVAGVEALVGNATGEEIRFLLAATDANGKTALDLAKASSHANSAAVVEKIEASAASIAEMDTDAPAAGAATATAAAAETEIDQDID